jgi:Fe-S cluster assembly scaffold protein SufB
VSLLGRTSGQPDLTSEQASRLAEIRRAAEDALSVPAALGPDIDVGGFPIVPRRDSVIGIGDIDPEILDSALTTGFTADEAQRSGSYFQLDRSPIYQHVAEDLEGQVELMCATDALARYPSEMIERWWWRAVHPGKDKYTAVVALHQTDGYFVRVRAGARIDRPIQTCLFVSEGGASQNVHNIIVVEEGAEAHIITGCTIHSGVDRGLHAGVSEFYVGRGATLTFSMLHSWGPGFAVRPRTGVVVEEDGLYVSNYVLLEPVGSIQSFPVARLEGDGGRAVFNSIVCGVGDSSIDLGSETQLIGDDTRAEAVTRTVSRDRSVVYARGRLVARTDRCRAHLDCRGILLSEKSTQWAIPVLACEGAPGAELSHEAAISPIAQEEIDYLMSRGVPQDEAISMITRGFVSIDIPGLPAALRRRIDEAVTQTGEGAL